MSYFLVSILLGLSIAFNASAQLPDWALEPEEPAEQEGVRSTIFDEAPSNPGEPTFQVGSEDYSAEQLKGLLLNLNRDLIILEEELLFPSSTQISVFVSMDVGTFFQLDSVRLEIDGNQVATHLYTESQLNALHRGAVQRLHLGNVKSGEHEVVALFTGKGPRNEEYKRAASIDIQKANEAITLELSITDSKNLQQPEFKFEEWVF